LRARSIIAAMIASTAKIFRKKTSGTHAMRMMKHLLDHVVVKLFRSFALRQGVLRQHGVARRLRPGVSRGRALTLPGGTAVWMDPSKVPAFPGFSRRCQGMVALKIRKLGQWDGSHGQGLPQPASVLL
jgi:hypothetical protein